jgi:hypothetical protein
MQYNFAICNLMDIGRVCAFELNFKNIKYDTTKFALSSPKNK